MYRWLIRCLYRIQIVCVVATALLMGIDMAAEFLRGGEAPLGLRLVAAVLTFAMVTPVTGLMTYACTWGAIMALRLTHLACRRMQGKLPDRLSFWVAYSIVGAAAINGVDALLDAMHAFPRWKTPGLSDYFAMFSFAGVIACMTVIAVCICLSLTVYVATVIRRRAHRAGLA